MKAIIENNKTYKVTGTKGDFTICEDSKGKCKMFQTLKVEIVEIDEMPKAKKYRGYKAPVSEKAKSNAKRRYAADKAYMAECIRLDTKF